MGSERQSRRLGALRATMRLQLSMPPEWRGFSRWPRTAEPPVLTLGIHSITLRVGVARGCSLAMCHQGEQMRKRIWLLSATAAVVAVFGSPAAMAEASTTTVAIHKA